MSQRDQNKLKFLKTKLLLKKIYKNVYDFCKTNKTSENDLKNQ